MIIPHGDRSLTHWLRYSTPLSQDNLCRQQIITRDQVIPFLWLQNRVSCSMPPADPSYPLGISKGRLIHFLLLPASLDRKGIYNNLRE